MENLLKEIDNKLDFLRNKGFHVIFEPYTIMGTKKHRIEIASSDKLINGVQHQYPDHISFSLSENLELQAQSFGGCGGGSIYRNIDPTNERERLYAMQSVKVPFRKPQSNDKAIIKAIDKLVQNYILTLLEVQKMGLLRYSDLADYEFLLR
jgi:hypothetical protein